MNGNRGYPRAANRPFRTVKNTATHNLTAVPRRLRLCAARDRRQDQAADAVDLRSSLDSGPLAAFVRIYAGNGNKPVTTGPAKGVDTAPPLQE